LKAKNILLYLAICFIWGTTWLVIKFQLENTGVISGVFYRFIAASIIMFGLNFFYKNKLKYPLQNHKFFILQGIFNFSINYNLTYLSEKYISSALVALTFTTLIYYNMIGMNLFFKKNIEVSAILGTILGGLGIFLLFSEEIFKANIDKNAIYGIGIGLIATLSASLGNMASLKNHEAKIPIMVFNAWSMLYGSIFSLIIGLIFGESFKVNPNTSYFLSLAYLTIFGTVIAFYAYQTLIHEIGAHKAAYSSIISPIIAVFVSMYFEKFEITFLIFLGMILAILGNYLVLKSRTTPAKQK
jgi:drug/metabolite transporter (DMT)-like permease